MTRKLKYSIFIAAFVFSLSSLTYSADYKEYISKGDELYKNFENVEALDYYEDAYKLAPDNYEVLLKLTRTANDAGEEFHEYRNHDKAAFYINKAVKYAEEFHKKFPDSSAVYAYLALSYGNLAMFKGGKGKIELAQKIESNAKKSISMNPHFYLPYIILGIYYREVANLSWFEKTFANTFFGKLPDGTFKDSEKMFNKALSIDSNMIVARYQLAKTYRYEDKTAKEKKLLEEVLKMPLRNFRDQFAVKKSERRLQNLKN